MTMLEIDLYRACKRNRKNDEEIQKKFDDGKGASTLYPDYAGFLRKDNSFRAPDVTSTKDSNGVTWVLGVNDVDPNTKRPQVSANEGVSLRKC